MKKTGDKALKDCYDHSTWVGGNCLTFAKALKNKLGKGSRLVDVVEPEESTLLLYPGRPHHVVVEHNGLLWDACGANTPLDLLVAWEEHLNRDLQLEPHNAKRARDQGLKVKPNLADVAERAAADVVDDK